MKLATMKLICLLVLVCGIFMLGLVFDIGYAQLVHERALEYWPRQESGALNLRMPGAILGTCLLLIGLYGLLPKLPARRNTTITFKGANGDITLQLKPIRKVLLKMMRRMPEVYSIKLNVCPDSDGRRAFIDADVILKNCAALGARQSAKIVAECLATTARSLLGLEDLSAVRLNVRGINVDVAATGKQIREQLSLRQAEEASTYAVAHPPIAAVMMENDESRTAVEHAAPTETDENTDVQHGQNTACADASNAASSTSTKSATASAPVSEPCCCCDCVSDAAVVSDDVELPPLVDQDVPLPPGPKINDDGELTSDDVIGSGDDDVMTPDAVVVDVLEPAPWKSTDVPEPAPEELVDDDVDEQN